MTTTIKNENVDDHLKYLKLPFMRENSYAIADTAAKEQWSHRKYLAALIEGEAALRKDRAVQRRIKIAHFPVIKTLEQYQWTWPKKINRLQIQNLFHLSFITNKTNVIFLGGVGLGKTHLATSLAYAACLRGHSVLFTTAIDVINALSTAQSAGRFQIELKRYLKPNILVLDELGYLPIDKHGADLLFQIISHRYEQGSIIVTSNRAFKDWPVIFNNDSTLTSAILDRLLHHSEVVLIDGNSYRMKEQIES